MDELRKFFHPDTPIKQVTETVVKAMEHYNKYLERQRREREER
jgi:ParB family chromosome partitioning protein